MEYTTISVYEGFTDIHLAIAKKNEVLILGSGKVSLVTKADQQGNVTYDVWVETLG